jgi:hypothetical protein
MSQLRILWTALSFSTVFFVVLVTGFRPAPAGPPQAILLPAFAFIAIGMIVVSFVLPRVGYKTAVDNARPEITEVTDASASDVIPYRDAPRRRVFAKPEEARRKAVVIFQTPFILGMALTESITLLGFTLGWLGHPMWAWAPFFAVGWELFALRFPTKQAVFGRFAEAKRAAFPD